MGLHKTNFEKLRDQVELARHMASAANNRLDGLTITIETISEDLLKKDRQIADLQRQVRTLNKG